MNLHYLRTVSRTSSTLLLRSWLFRLFFLLSFCCILFLQATRQSDLIHTFTSGLTDLPSFIPYVNAYLFTIFQVFPLLFLAGIFLNKDRKLDSMDTVYYRPESNAEYIWGMCLGFVRVFFRMAVISLLLAAMINIFGSKTPFNPLIYLFYLFTLIMPAMIFMLGLAFFVISWIQSQAVNLIVLLGYLAITLFYIGDAQQGLFDPLGISLPNVFSEITGQADMGTYLLQRACWLFLGLGFIGLSIVNFKRLPNHPGNKVAYIRSMSVFMIVGLFFGLLAFFSMKETQASRLTYAKTYDKYAGTAKLAILKQDIDFEQDGKRMKGKSRLKVLNQSGKNLSEILLYLNPDLNVKEITSGGVALPFEREHQVIRIDRNSAPGQEDEIEITYEGGIDESICYLDVPEDVISNTAFNSHMGCRFGKKYAFLQQEYVLLIPECLWYPVSVPPVNPQFSYDIPKNFTEYTLRVSNPENKTVISQGESSQQGNQVLFTNKQRLPGIMLCIGEYEKRKIESEDISYELYLFKGHGELLKGLEVLNDTLPQFLSDFRHRVELKLGNDYPYSRFVMAETPITFATYYRNERGGSEYIQPELAFIPERGFGKWVDLKLESRLMFMQREPGYGGPEMSEKNLLLIMLNQRLDHWFTGGYGWSGDSSPLVGLLNLVSGPSHAMRSSFFPDRNLHDISPMFYNYITSIHSETYPVMDAIIHKLRKTERGRSVFRGMGSIAGERNQKAIDYLSGKSLENALADKTLSPVLLHEILSYKAQDIFNRIDLNGVNTDDFVAYLEEYIREYAFEKIEFSQLNAAVEEKYQISWTDLLPEWYVQDRIPRFYVKDLVMETVGDEPNRGAPDMGAMRGGRRGQMAFSIMGGSSSQAMLRFSVFNDSDVDGIVTLSSSYVQMPSQGRGELRAASFMQNVEERMETRNYAVPAQKGKEVAVLLDERPMSCTFNTNISLNLPHQFRVGMFGSVGYTKDTAQYERELNASYFDSDPHEIIVDNEDKGFSLSHSESRFKISNWFRDRKGTQDKYDDGMIIFGLTGNSWRANIDENSYGKHIRSRVYKSAGKGEAIATWTTEISREGEYEVAAYFADNGGMVVGGIVRTSRSRGRSTVTVNSGFLPGEGSQEPSEVLQYYTLASDGGVEEISLDVKNATGWMSLGRFYFTPGTYSVVLSDKGENGQLIVGDAVKWTYLGD